MPDDTTASLARRSYHSLLHPLQMRQGGEGEYARTRMSIRINDGEPFDSGFPALPAALYPWVLMSREGDVVNLVSLEQLDKPS
jgi:hypothetical protein